MVLQLLRLLLARQHAVFAGDDYNSERPTVEQLLLQVLPLLLLPLHALLGCLVANTFVNVQTSQTYESTST